MFHTPSPPHFYNGISVILRIDLNEEQKHSRTSPDVLFKEFSLTKQKTRTDYELIGETIYKKSDPKNRKNSKNQSEIAACEQKNN